MKILVVGGGGREHVLGWAIGKSPGVEKIFFAPGNAGTSRIGENVPIAADDIPQLVKWAKSHDVALTIVGPENPIMAGIAEEFSKEKLLVFGPSRQGGMLEGSKTWAKEFMIRNGIPTAKAKTFFSFDEARKDLPDASYPLVVKADGLAQGKGVAVCMNREEAEESLHAFMIRGEVGRAAETILIEDFLEGEELSAFAIFDGKRFCYLGEARDYKQARDHNRGPNTGGMGAVSSSTLIDSALRKTIVGEIFQKTLDGLIREKIDYKGVLYAGLKLTSEGPRVLEFNVRFGDPEAQVLLPRMKDDALSLFLAAAKGDLSKDTAALEKNSAVGVVIAAEGYPGKYEKGIPLPSLNDFSEKILIFHAATKLQNGKILNQGGRTLTVVAVADSIEIARQRVYQELKRFSWSGYFYRSDIGEFRSVAVQ